MRERWILFYDGACPLCSKAQNKILTMMSDDVKLTTVDLNSPIAKASKFANDQVVLQTPDQIYHGYEACAKILSKTRYGWLVSPRISPLTRLVFRFVSKNRHWMK